MALVGENEMAIDTVWARTLATSETSDLRMCRTSFGAAANI
jgi:hypothetical protein